MGKVNSLFCLFHFSERMYVPKNSELEILPRALILLPEEMTAPPTGVLPIVPCGCPCFEPNQPKHVKETRKEQSSSSQLVRLFKMETVNIG